MRLHWESWIDATHASRVAAGRNALQRLGMDYVDLDRIGDSQVDGLQQIFLTSSSVQGLSTHKSDIDLIAIGEIDDDEERAPAQLFMHGRRFELIVFNRAEVDRMLATLSTVAQSGILPALQAMRSWDRRQTIRQKYVERIVNGVSSTSETPYLKYLPSLATVWQFLAFDKARQFIICTFLAERCGERRSHRAYALRAMVHMMDMLMSAHGLVYSNVKWISLRWHKFRQAGPSEVIPSTLLGEVDALWEKVLPAYLGAAAPPFGNALLALFNKICEALALDADLKPQSAVELFQRKGSVLPFCGGSSVAFEPRGIITLFQTTDAQPPPLEWLNQLAELAPDHAGSLLRGSRARLVDFSLSSSPESAS